MLPHEALTLSFSPTTLPNLDAKPMVNAFFMSGFGLDTIGKVLSVPASIGVETVGKALSVPASIGAETVGKALSVPADFGTEVIGKASSIPTLLGGALALPPPDGYDAIGTNMPKGPLPDYANFDAGTMSKALMRSLSANFDADTLSKALTLSAPADSNAETMSKALILSLHANFDKPKALTPSRTQNLLTDLDTKTVAEAYQRLGSASDKNFESNMQVVTQNVMEIDDYMSHVWQILSHAEGEIFRGGPPFLTQWRTLHERFRNALQQSRDLAMRLADKIRVFYEDILPLFQDDYSQVAMKRKVEAFRRFAGGDDADSVDRSMLKDQEACEKLGREFDDLRVDIASFVASFEGSVRSSDESFEKRVREIKERLRQTDEALQRSRNPFEAFKAVFGGARSSQDIFNEMRFLDRELGDAARLHDIIHHLLYSGLPIIHEEVNRIGPKMKVFGEIWAYLRAQAQEARLNMGQSIGDELPEFLRSDIVKETRIGYLKLFICVEQYATNLEPIFARGF